VRAGAEAGQDVLDAAFVLPEAAVDQGKLGLGDGAVGEAAGDGHDQADKLTEEPVENAWLVG
jgi:hypothetical protein